MDVLKSDLQILYMKKRRAQAEVDMFNEAIERTSEIEFNDDGEHALLLQFSYTKTDAYNALLELLSFEPHTNDDDSSDNPFDDSSVSSNA
jgi:hypothetical protein